MGQSSEPDSIVACWSSPLAGLCDASNKLHSMETHTKVHATDHHHCSHSYSTIIKGRLHMVHTLLQFLNVMCCVLCSPSLDWCDAIVSM